MKKKQHEKEHFAGMMFQRSLIPCVVSSVGLAFSDMADAIVVGQRMGEVGLAAISLSLPVYMVINLFMHGLGGGGSIRFSRLMGEGKSKEASESFSMILQAGIVFSMLLSISGLFFLPQVLSFLGAASKNMELYLTSKSYLSVIMRGMPLFFISYILSYYLRNADGQKLASIGFSIGNGCDIVLNILLVLYFDMGAAGAALSTVSGQAITVLLYLIGMKMRSYPLHFHLIPFNFSHVISCFRVGFSVSVQYVFQMIFLLIANNSLIRTGGAIGVAVFDLVQNASYLPVYVYDGISKAAQPLLSTFLGEHNDSGRRYTIKCSLFAGTFLGIATAFFLCFAPDLLCKIFGLTNPDALQLGAKALQIYSFGIVFAGCSILLEYFFQAYEQEKPAMLIATLRGAVILLPLTIFFAACPIDWFWWLFPATEVLSLGVFLIWLKITKIKMDSFDPNRILGKTIEGKNQDIGVLTDDIEAFCEKWGFSPQQQFFTIMAAEEVCLAIIENGFKNQPGGYIQITLVASYEGLLELHIRDNAVSFNPFSLDTAAVGEEEFDPDTIGIYVIKQKAADFFYRRYQGFNSMVIKI